MSGFLVSALATVWILREVMGGFFFIGICWGVVWCGSGSELVLEVEWE